MKEVEKRRVRGEKEGERTERRRGEAIGGETRASLHCSGGSSLFKDDEHGSGGGMSNHDKRSDNG